MSCRKTNTSNEDGEENGIRWQRQVVDERQRNSELNNGIILQARSYVRKPKSS